VATAGRRAGGRRAARVLTGLEVLARERPRWLRGRRVGLLLHPASVTAELVSARDVVRRLCGDGLCALFGPQHGFAGEKQDNMIESGHGVDAELGIDAVSRLDHVVLLLAGEAVLRAEEGAQAIAAETAHDVACRDQLGRDGRGVQEETDAPTASVTAEL